MAAQKTAVSKSTSSRDARPSRQSGNGAAARRSRQASASYLALAKSFPIKPIDCDAELDEAIAILDSLLSRTKPLDSMENGYLESLSHEIERYEAEAHPMPPVSDAEMLRHLIDAKEVTMSEVAGATGIAISTISSVLAGKRRLNRNHIAKLAAYFGVEPGVFLD